MSGDPESLVRAVASVYSLPDTFLRLTDVIQQPRSSAADIAKVVGSDTGLSSRLLKLANSVMYGFPRRIETISHAIALIGTTQIEQLALASSVVTVFQKIPKDLVDMPSFWKHSFACGLLARSIAQHCKQSAPERFFVAGLLHDIGRLVLYMKRAPQIAEAIQKSRDDKRPLFQVEGDILGYHHGHVGAELLKLWKIPPIHQQAAEYHHNPALAKVAPIETAVIHVADVAVNAIGWGTSGQRGVPQFQPVAWDGLGAVPEIVPSLIEAVDAQLAETMKIIMS